MLGPELSIIDNSNIISVISNVLALEANPDLELTRNERSLILQFRSHDLPAKISFRENNDDFFVGLNTLDGEKFLLYVADFKSRSVTSLCFHDEEPGQGYSILVSNLEKNAGILYRQAQRSHFFEIPISDRTFFVEIVDRQISEISVQEGRFAYHYDQRGILSSIIADSRFVYEKIHDTYNSDIRIPNDYYIRRLI